MKEEKSCEKKWVVEVESEPDPEEKPVTELKAWMNPNGTVEIHFLGPNLNSMKTFLEDISEMLRGY